MFSCVRQPTQDVQNRNCSKSHRHCKCSVELTLNGMEGVTLSNGVLFAKVRLLSGGQFCRYSSRREIRDNRVNWSGGSSTDGGIENGGSNQYAVEPPLQFSCRLPPGALRVSVRKEEKGGRSFSKLGFVNIDLSSVGCRERPEERAFILTPYSPNQRLDNSTVRLSLYLRCLPEEPLEVSAPLHLLTFQQQQQQPIQQKQPSPMSQVPSPPITDWRRQSDSSSLSLLQGVSGDSRAGSLSRDSTLTTPTASSANAAASSCQSSGSSSSAADSGGSLAVDRIRTSCRPISARGELPERIVSTRADNHSIVEQVLQEQGIDLSAARKLSG